MGGRHTKSDAIAEGNPNEPIIWHVVDDSMKSVEKEPLVNLSEQKKNSHLNQKRAYFSHFLEVNICITGWFKISCTKKKERETKTPKEFPYSEIKKSIRRF